MRAVSNTSPISNLAIIGRLDDKKRGRAAARGLGLAVGGLLGELLHARQQGWVPDLRDEIARLRREAGFFMDLEIERFILAQVGE